MRRSGPIARRTPLRAKRKRGVATEQRAAAAAWYMIVTQRCCVVCGKSRYEAWKAGTRLTGHHVIPKQTLKRRGLAEHLWDPDNGVAVCWSPCHEDHTSRMRPIPFESLPPEAVAFAERLDLLYVIEKLYPLSVDIG